MRLGIGKIYSLPTLYASREGEPPGSLEAEVGAYWRSPAFWNCVDRKQHSPMMGRRAGNARPGLASLL